MIIETVGHPFAYEVECVARLFFPGAKIHMNPTEEIEGDPGRIRVEISRDGDELLLRVHVRLGDFDKSLAEHHPADLANNERERLLCALLFQLLCEHTGVRPPWGILTGIRPVRRCHQWRESGMSDREITAAFTERYFALPSKAELALQTAGVESGILRQNRLDGFSLYVSIPFCPTRCLYCSFVSHDIKGMRKLLPDYLRLLCAELEAIAETARECGLVLQTIYIGGGTPTTLEPEQLEIILSAIAAQFDLSALTEYTVEAGRPDTITAEKLQILRKYGVDRLSINPQTMDDTVLADIGRAHTAADVVKAFALAREAGFSVINTDLIAGLPSESPEGFRAGLEQVINLEPENITVHTLTVKRSSRLREEDGAFQDVDYDLSALLDDTRLRLGQMEYRPYYLYRQKGTRQNLENVGYAKAGCESAYNVFIMEEIHTVLAAGAGAVTKLCAPPGRIQRIFNFKFPYEYLSRHNEVLERKNTQTIRSFFNDEGNQR